MDIIVLDYSDCSVNIVHNIPDKLSSFEVEEILNKQFHLSNCSWMSADNYSVCHYRYNNNELIYEGC